MVQILSHTPIWVYALFLVLLGFGLMQTRTRTVTKIPALLLPVGMIALSLAGIKSSFGFTTIPLAAWAWPWPLQPFLDTPFSEIRGFATTQRTVFPGHWVPLVMMPILHVYGHECPVSHTNVIGAFALLYPLSGYFLQGL